MLTILGVFILGWDVAAVIALFWFENLVLGFWNVFKMILARGDTEGLKSKDGTPITPEMLKWMIFIIVPFFVVHFSGFCAGHAIFINALVFEDVSIAGGLLLPALALIERIFTTDLFVGAVLLVASHGYSFFVNYLRKKEYLKVNAIRLMIQPYGRIFIMHIAIMLMAFFIMGSGEEKKLMIIPFVLVKTLIDLRLHLRQHNNPDRLTFF